MSEQRLNATERDQVIAAVKKCAGCADRMEDLYHFLSGNPSNGPEDKGAIFRIEDHLRTLNHRTEKSETRLDNHDSWRAKIEERTCRIGEPQRNNIIHQVIGIVGKLPSWGQVIIIALLLVLLALAGVDYFKDAVI